ncbi:ABC transporter permease [Anaerosinus massiliensis]|uniref:ABC transporter permease n=1 Tax=Massilibacillus massiliensis TaxID=1806837 RepID=UPI000DA6281B|nr:ABC transporter permease [Massilibacillus massiliensis]
MLVYLLNYPDKLGMAILEHLEIVIITTMISLPLAAFLTVVALHSKFVEKIFIHLFSVIYSIPSLAFFAILIPLTGLGKITAIIVMVMYSQYILLRNFVSGLHEVDPSVIEAARGMGMTDRQILLKIQVPLARNALFTGIRLSIISTIGIATIAAFINAGGLGNILFDGLRSFNINKIMWGSILSAALAIGMNLFLSKVEKLCCRKMIWHKVCKKNGEPVLGADK